MWLTFFENLLIVFAVIFTGIGWLYALFIGHRWELKVPPRNMKSRFITAFLPLMVWIIITAALWTIVEYI